MRIPEIMHCIETPVAGDPDIMQLVTDSVPKPKNDEVLVRVMAAGVNRPDIFQRKGLYPPPPGANPVLGLEMAGEVVAKGNDVCNFNDGDYVCGLTNGGAYAEYCTIPASQCLPWPKGYDAIHAAAIPENYFTVWANVFLQGRLGKGESLLVHGGSSGIGITAIQLAHEFAGRVYATAGNEEKCDACCKLGADNCINYKEEDFEKCIFKLTDGRGVDMVLDMVGAAYFARNLNCLAMDGRLVEISTQEGAIVEHFDLGQVMKKRLSITGSTMRPRSSKEKGAIAASLQQIVWPALEQGRCKPAIYKVFPLAEANEAHQLMESSQHIGKIILSV